MLTTSISLVERLKGRDDAAWSRFVSVYGPVVERVGRVHGLADDERASLVQDFLVRALETLPEFRYDPARGRFRDWVRSVARNELRRRWRAERAYADAVAGYRSRADAEVQDDETWADRWRRFERERLLELALEGLARELEPTKLAVFRMLVLEDRQPAEVAGFYGLRPGHVALIKCRALQRLREILRELEVDLDGR